jgi:branched-chain amino acid transport system permease protein/neutral amino acid transport system permease protein
MAGTQRIESDFGDRVRGVQRAVAVFAGGVGLWGAIVLFFLWAFMVERDALVTGVTIGAIYALGALGVTLIFGVLRFANFAHGDSMMLAAYVAFFLVTGTVTGESQNVDQSILPVSLADLPGATDNIWHFSFGYALLLGMVGAAVIMVGLFILLDRIIYRRLRLSKGGVITFAIASLGLALMIRSVMLIFWGSSPRFYNPGLRETVDIIFDIRLLYDQIFILGMTALMLVSTYYLLFRTRLGKAMRAMSDNPDLARISGINTDRVVLWTWTVAGGLVAVAGVMLALQAQMKPELGFIILLPLFAATILGGIGSPRGAVLGGFIVGSVQEVSVTFDFLSPGYKFSTSLVIIILILLVRPNGLFGERDQ